MPIDENPVEEIKDSREAIDDLLTVMYRCHGLDDNTRSIETELQSLIEREFQRIDQAVTDLDS